MLNVNFFLIYLRKVESNSYFKKEVSQEEINIRVLIFRIKGFDFLNKNQTLLFYILRDKKMEIYK